MIERRRKDDKKKYWFQPGPVLSILVLLLIVFSLVSGLTNNTSREDFQKSVEIEHGLHMLGLAHIRQDIEKHCQ